MSEAMDKHGDGFPYIKVYPLAGTESLNHRNYPHLYYAALKYELNSKNINDNYAMTQLPTSVPKSAIDRKLMKTADVEEILSEEHKNILRSLGYEIRSVTGRKRKHQDQEEYMSED